MTSAHSRPPGRLVRAGGYQYDVAFSFAGENRPYVDDVAMALAKQGIAVYYDRFEKVTVWGENLYVYLDTVYRTKSRYCVLFVSKEYAEKLWTRHELASALDRAFRENEAYILPARFDDTEVPGLLGTIAYLDLRGMPPESFAARIIEKLGAGAPHPEPDLLWPENPLEMPADLPPTSSRPSPPEFRSTRLVAMPEWLAEE